jgi:hypothetical protein
VRQFGQSWNQQGNAKAYKLGKQEVVTDRHSEYKDGDTDAVNLVDVLIVYRFKVFTLLSLINELERKVGLECRVAHEKIPV